MKGDTRMYTLLDVRYIPNSPSVRVLIGVLYIIISAGSSTGKKLLQVGQRHRVARRKILQKIKRTALLPLSPTNPVVRAQACGVDPPLWYS